MKKMMLHKRCIIETKKSLQTLLCYPERQHKEETGEIYIGIDEEKRPSDFF